MASTGRDDRGCDLVSSKNTCERIEVANHELHRMVGTWHMNGKEYRKDCTHCNVGCGHTSL